MTRIEAIGSLIPKCPVIADIGCDHGKISEYIIQNNLAEQRLTVNDISAASLEKARKNLGSLLVSDLSCRPPCSITFLHKDGAKLPKGIDCAVIAGMGGREILRILQGTVPKCAVVSPQSFQEGLRRGFWQINRRVGYCIDADMTVLDNGKFYDVIRIVRKSVGREPPDECALLYGFYYRQRNPSLLARLLRDKQKYGSYKNTPENQKKLRIIEEVLTWQQ